MHSTRFNTAYPNLNNWNYTSNVPRSMPKPSAPPAEDNFNYKGPAPSAPPLEEPSEHSQAALNLDDDCTICLDRMRDKPTGDGRSATVIAKTTCNHYFHDFCLQRHLGAGVNKDCPLCRLNLADKMISKITVKDIAAPLATQPQQVPAQVQPNSPLFEGNPLADVANATAAISKQAFWGISSLAFAGLKLGGSALVSGAKALFAPDPNAHSKMKRWVEKRSVEQLDEWNATTKRLINQAKKQTEEVQVVLATICSLTSNQNDRAKKVLENVEESTRVFEMKIKEAYKDLQNKLEYQKRILAQ